VLEFFFIPNDSDERLKIIDNFWKILECFRGWNFVESLIEIGREIDVESLRWDGERWRFE
jgi:hypothetical protein